MNAMDTQAYSNALARGEYATADLIRTTAQRQVPTGGLAMSSRDTQAYSNALARGEYATADLILSTARNGGR